jgi:hypothetical protein
MTPLGKPLVFCLKYWTEMERLYGDSENSEGLELDLAGLDDAQHIREMARTVGAAAHEQGGEILDLCGKGIDDHFNGLGVAKLSSKRKRATVVRDWCW